MRGRVGRGLTKIRSLLLCGMEIIFARTGLDLDAIQDMGEMKAGFTAMIAQDLESRGFKGWSSPAGSPAASKKPKGEAEHPRLLEKVRLSEQPERSEQFQMFKQGQTPSGSSTFDLASPKAYGASRAETPSKNE